MTMFILSSVIYKNVYKFLMKFIGEVSRLQREFDMAQEYIQNVSNIDVNIEAMTEKAACAEKIGHVEEARSLYLKALHIPKEYAPLHRR